jgi:hypothetical protein
VHRELIPHDPFLLRISEPGLHKITEGWGRAEEVWDQTLDGLEIPN